MATAKKTPVKKAPAPETFKFVPPTEDIQFDIVSSKEGEVGSITKNGNELSTNYDSISAGSVSIQLDDSSLKDLEAGINFLEACKTLLA